ncbi:hypothetical protein Cadr_000006030 [Camelus dromedarius]|uniref:Uncharacterized protein n=1 Tax=Camelus dromedarius TaxID=9838 RepID=A0A5N4E0T5_CAMDR|nr:hypothetical protein Cadr_000006030 [Camelus dromedarius]
MPCVRTSWCPGGPGGLWRRRLPRLLSLLRPEAAWRPRVQAPPAESGVYDGAGEGRAGPRIAHFTFKDQPSARYRDDAILCGIQQRMKNRKNFSCKRYEWENFGYPEVRM